MFWTVSLPVIIHTLVRLAITQRLVSACALGRIVTEGFSMIAYRAFDGSWSCLPKSGKAVLTEARRNGEVKYTRDPRAKQCFCEAPLVVVSGEISGR